MVFESELHLTQRAFAGCLVQSKVHNVNAPIGEWIDLGRSGLLGQSEYYGLTFEQAVAPLQARVLYKRQDAFGCRSIFLRLPEEIGILYIGPFLNEEFSMQDILHYMEKNKVPHMFLKTMEHYYGSLPVLPDSSHLYVLLDAFAERLWGGRDRFAVELLSRNEPVLSPLKTKSDHLEQEKMLWDMRRMEQRYAFENEMIQSVIRGQIEKADSFLQVFSGNALEKRAADPLRNSKNYCIIMNTLFRKAAEQGGVHPLYIDRISSSFAFRIENLDGVGKVKGLMQDMFRAYCRLVRENTMKSYSSTVRKTIVCIDSDLSADLSLRRLAEMQNVSSAYLSALFHKETGQTLTDYITLKRMELAKHLLSTTDLLVQSVAQHCGILDVHYFSRLFKKYTGKTPKEFRASV